MRFNYIDYINLDYINLIKTYTYFPNYITNLTQNINKSLKYRVNVFEDITYKA